MANFGAAPVDWDHLSLVLGLTQDLLPVVSNPNAKISPTSNMKGVGKTPSTFNGRREVVGFPQWTHHRSTPADIAKWRKEPDYGICIQTRTVRAIDIDVEDHHTSNDIVEAIGAHLQGLDLPTRIRSNSNKCLLIFQLPGDMPKRVIKLDKGIIEFLATGQQFIACGTHTSGVPYEWLDGLPPDIPTLSSEEFESLWSHLALAFGTSDTVSTSPSKAKVLGEAISKDPIASYLVANGWVKSQEKDGRLHITCPFEAEHTSESAISATTYFPANTGGYQFGHFDCRHAHCEHRTDDDFKGAIGLPVHDPFDDFEILPQQDAANPPKTPQNATLGELIAQKEAVRAKRFTVVPADAFAQAGSISWLIKGVIPKAEMGVIYGESASGKTFFVLDLVFAIVRGEPWRGHRVEQGTVVYICAEGAGGMRSRLRAYAGHNGVVLADLALGIIPDAPNFMAVPEVKEVLSAIREFGPVSLIVVDTFAQVMAGANENAGEDVGKALAHCKVLHKHTGAVVLLVHHSGKDASKGARGWSGLRAACDFEIEVNRCDDDRSATVTKLKDGQDGAEFGFKLLTVPIGMDEDDEVISSCVIEHGEAKRVGRADTSAAAVKKGKHQAMVLACLSELVGLGGADVAQTDLIAAATSQLIAPEAGKKDRRRELVVQALDALRERGEVEYFEGFVRLVKGEM